MTQMQLDQLVAVATGEDVRAISQRGFSIAPTSQEINPKQVHSRRIHNAAIVTDAPLPIEYGHMKPVVIRMKPRRPQYGSYVAVREVNL